MSNSNRNVRPNVGSTGRSGGRDASHNLVPLPEFFDDPRQLASNAAQAQQVLEAEELPNQKITWTIRLNHINITRVELSQLSTELRNNHNMDLFQSNPNGDIVTISGILPDNDFDEHRLIEVVRTYAPNAIVV